jgi:UDP-4-amino-4,6-dideoxy-N-acetyl-beta-L-altrosamine transaminase
MKMTANSREAPAIAGGVPVRGTLLPYGRQAVEEADIQAVAEVLRSDWLTTGPKVGEFEEAFAEAVGARYAVSFSSGTAALHGAAYAAGLGPGDEAVTTPMTFCATANCVLYQGAQPVFADVSSDTLNLDPEQARLRVTPRTKAVLAVDYGGHAADLDALMGMAEEHGLTLIEDASHALGGEYGGRRVGSVAHLTTFSLHPVKHLTTGEGGMVTTGRADWAETLRRFRNHGISSDARQRQITGQWQYEMVLLGMNHRLPDINCGLGLSQMKRLGANLGRRREIAAVYQERLGSLPGLILPSIRAGVNPAWHLYAVRVDASQLTVGRAEVFRALRAENIGVNVHYIPVHLHPYYRERFGFQGGEYPMAEAAYEGLLSLPMFHAMTGQDVEDVVHAVGKVLRYYAG